MMRQRCEQAAAVPEQTRRAVDGRSEAAHQIVGPKKIVSIPPAYIVEVIKRLHVEKESVDAERRKEVAEQVQVLESLKVVLESRLSSGRSSSAVPFDSNLDDTEALLLLMLNIDTNCNGSISDTELLASTALNQELHRAFRSAFGCDHGAMEEALAHLSDNDFGEYRQVRKEQGGASGTFDRKASAQAVFQAALRTTAIANANASQPAAGQDAQATGGRVYQAVRESIPMADAGGAAQSNLATKAGLEHLATSLGTSSLAAALKGLAKTLLGEGIELDFLAVKKAARRVPRVVGQRMEWAKGVQLDALLAQHLPPGCLEDGLAGLRSMPFDYALQAVDVFLLDARIKILEALLKTKSNRGSKSAVEANNKFAGGFQGSFASLKDFHAGAEASLHLGYPNPDTMKGIMLEFTKHPSVERLFVTPNYRIVTNLLIEFAWAMYDTDSEAEFLQKAREFIRKLNAERFGYEDELASVPAKQLLFPGEVGNSFSESLVIFTFPGVLVGSAQNVKACESAAKAKAEELLKTGEEKVRGITILNHGECMELIRRDTSVLLSELNEQAAIVDSSLRMGLKLPMSLTRTNKVMEELWSAVAAAAGGKNMTAVVKECTWAFSRYTGLDGLQSWLEEVSLDDLKKALEDEREQTVPVWVVDSADMSSREALCQTMVASFVRTELQADLRAALDSSASDAQIEELLKGWNVPEPWAAGRRDRINQAAAALDSKDKWFMVEGWVRLYLKRIQGRTRLGLEGLMEREAVKIKQYGLSTGEVLATYLYTGPGFVPMNCIYRSFPQNILDLLKGDEVTADNQLCTTLFCISSALKKLSQTTELPESRYAATEMQLLP
jgi:hypothetical protein